MNVSGKHITIALTLSVLLIIFNIIAVTQGTADNFYYQIEMLLRSFSNKYH